MYQPQRAGVEGWKDGKKGRMAKEHSTCASSAGTPSPLRKCVELQQVSKGWSDQAGSWWECTHWSQVLYLRTAEAAQPLGTHQKWAGILETSPKSHWFSSTEHKTVVFRAKLDSDMENGMGNGVNRTQTYEITEISRLGKTFKIKSSHKANIAKPTKWKYSEIWPAKPSGTWLPSTSSSIWKAPAPWAYKSAPFKCLVLVYN